MTDTNILDGDGDEMLCFVADCSPDGKSKLLKLLERQKLAAWAELLINSIDLSLEDEKTSIISKVKSEVYLTL